MLCQGVGNFGNVKIGHFNSDSATLVITFLFFQHDEWLQGQDQHWAAIHDGKQFQVQLCSHGKKTSHEQKHHLTTAVRECLEKSSRKKSYLIPFHRHCKFMEASGRQRVPVKFEYPQLRIDLKGLGQGPSPGVPHVVPAAMERRKSTRNVRFMKALLTFRTAFCVPQPILITN